MNFTELGLSESIVRAVSDKGYTTPSPIQALAIPEAMSGRDVLGCAQTGTGKTCAFALPILHQLSENRGGNVGSNHRKGRFGYPPRALVLCPTRELAMQIHESFVAYGRNLKLRHGVVFGGVPQGKQVRALRAGVDVLVATPGRLLDLINQGHIDLSQIETLVLDEADRMLDMGFIHDIRQVVELMPEDRQTLFFSATVSREIRALTDTLLDDPARIETAPESTTAESIAQRVYTVDRGNKAELLERILIGDDVNRALIFTRTKYGADKLVKVLNRADIEAEAIHGDKSQNARTRTMKRFKAGRTKVLVATDIASRGIDVDDITHVVNFDMPIDPETYVHRIGRTARAGNSGIAISLCDHGEMGIYRAIERRTKIRIEVGSDHQDLTFEAPEQRFGGGGKPRRGGGGGGRSFGGGQGGRNGGRQGGRSDHRSGGRSGGYGGQSDDRSSGKPGGGKSYEKAAGSFEGKPVGGGKAKGKGKKKYLKAAESAGGDVGRPVKAKKSFGHRKGGKPQGGEVGHPLGGSNGRSGGQTGGKPVGKGGKPGSGVKRSRVHRSEISGGKPSGGRSGRVTSW